VDSSTLHALNGLHLPQMGKVQYSFRMLDGSSVAPSALVLIALQSMLLMAYTFRTRGRYSTVLEC
jgi:hypothetical protein